MIIYNYLIDLKTLNAKMVFSKLSAMINLRQNFYGRILVLFISLRYTKSNNNR